MVILFDLLRNRAIHPGVIDRLRLAAVREVHTRIDHGGLGGKIVLQPWTPAWLPLLAHQDTMDDGPNRRYWENNGRADIEPNRSI